MCNLLKVQIFLHLEQVSRWIYRKLGRILTNTVFFRIIFLSIVHYSYKISKFLYCWRVKKLSKYRTLHIIYIENLWKNLIEFILTFMESVILLILKYHWKLNIDHIEISFAIANYRLVGRIIANSTSRFPCFA